MAIPERDTIYSADTPNRTVYTRESNATGWFVGIIVALALLAIGYLVFSANNSGPAPTTVDVNNTPAITTQVPADTSTQPMTDSTTAPMTDATPSTTAPAAPVTDAPSTMQVEPAPAP